MSWNGHEASQPERGLSRVVEQAPGGVPRLHDRARRGPGGLPGGV